MEEFNSFLNKVRIKQNLIKENTIKVNKLIFNDVLFRYKNQSQPAISINNLSLELEKNILTMGESGSSESTLLDILTGVIEIDEGKIIVNDKYQSKSLKNIKIIFLIFHKILIF